jgi:hypothetical protein
MNILKGETSVQETALKHGLTVAESKIGKSASWLGGERASVQAEGRRWSEGRSDQEAQAEGRRAGARRGPF